MNSNSEENNLEQSQSPGNVSPPAGIPVSPVSKKKRPWWIYLLIASGSILVLGIIAFLGIYSYYRSLINNYTETKPRSFPTIVASKEHVQNLFSRWTNYVADVLDRHSSEPFILTEEDINQIIVNFNKGRDIARVLITNGYIRALISIPLDNSGKKELRGRYLNADIDLKLQVEDGILALRVKSIQANGKPAPQWIVRKIQQKNFLENLENNYDLLELIQAMDSIQVKDGAIVFTPLQNDK